MLFKELDKIVSKINSLDEKKSIPAFRDEMIRHNASLPKAIRSGDNKQVSELLLNSIVAGVIQIVIKTIPKFVNIMVKVVKNPKTAPDVRCAVAGALAYLVQPHDLIPDDAPGGYGFLDDAVLLHAAASEYLRMNPSLIAEAKNELNVAKLAASIGPPEIIPSIQNMVAGATYGFQVLGQLPATMLNKITEQIIANPFMAGLSQSMPGSQSTGRSRGMSELEKRNLLGMSLISEGGTIAATFPDGSGVVLSG